MTTVKIIADSISPRNHRLTTFYVKFPRIVEAELLRHRAFSFSAASSRAINLEKHIENVTKEMFVPCPFTKDCKGMSAKELLDIKEYSEAEQLWLDGGFYIKNIVRRLKELGVHKQHASRLFQPFEYQEMILSATELKNFFELRCPKYTWEDKVFYSKKDFEGYFTGFNFAFTRGNGDTYSFDYENPFLWHSINTSTAQPEIQILAEMMWDEYNSSIPKELEDEWHIPYNSNIPDTFTVKEKIKIACARIARISYLTNNEDYEKDVLLYDKLVSMKHWSPLEHVAKCMGDFEYNTFTSQGMVNGELYQKKGTCNNFIGFIQQRFFEENSV